MKLNKSDILVIIALPVESQGLFEKNQIPIHYCGIGKVNAASTVAALLAKGNYKRVLNLGTAGSHKFPTHSLVECSGYVQRDMDLSPLGFPRGETPMDPVPGKIEFATIINHLKKGVCGTGDSFEVGPPKLDCDLVDMESYAIAKVCKKMNVELTAIKYITDGSDHQAHKDWSENLPPAAKALLGMYNELVE